MEGFCGSQRHPKMPLMNIPEAKRFFSVPNAIREAKILSKILTLLNTFKLSK